MSTYLYLRCLDHDPPVSSDGEVGQHLYDLPQVRKDIAHRGLIVAVARAELDVDYRDFFRTNTAQFLCEHPKCRIEIYDEYGVVHPLTPPEGEHA